jgi:hypothetical protein
MTTISGPGMSAHYNTIAATRAQRPDPMKSVADTLGMTGDELKTQLRSGQSLVEVASGRNVEDDRLVAAVKDGPPPDAAADATRPPPSGQRGQVAALDDAAKAGRLSNLLDVGADELTSKVGNAKELVDLMRERGIDLGQLRSILSSGDLLDVSM